MMHFDPLLTYVARMLQVQRFESRSVVLFANCAIVSTAYFLFTILCGKFMPANIINFTPIRIQMEFLRSLCGLHAYLYD